MQRGVSVRGGWGSAGGTMDGSALPQIFSVEMARLRLIPFGFRLVWLGLLQHCVQLGQQLITGPAVSGLDYIIKQADRLPQQLRTPDAVGVTALRMIKPVPELR